MSTIQSSEVDVADLAHNPFNPPSRSETGSELAASIGRMGVVNALVVVPAEAWVQANPEHAELVGACTWVVVDGNRRLAGARAASLTSVPVHMRVDVRPADLTEEALLHSNLHRALSPLEEAGIYAATLERTGMSQRELAAGLGVGQSTIAKRLALLKLPEPVLELIAAEQIGPKAALHLTGGSERAQILAAERIAGGVWPPETALTQAAQTLRRQDADELAATHGVRVVFGGHADLVPLAKETDPREVADSEGTVVVVPAEVDEQPPRLAVIPARPDRGQLSAEDERRRADERERRRSGKAREHHLLEMVRRRPRAGELAALTQRVVLRGGVLNAASADLAVRVRRTAEGEDGGDGWDLRREVARTPAQERAGAAWLVGLCIEEALAREARAWTSLDAEYLALLRAHGYAPSAWELARLDALTKTEEEQS
ncbi:MAG: ParB/RepB/Spo0J family partition protein [Micrococcus sp.]|nr:ParB/RepB/Spo0J family partition protein [Micrococcus sp.]